MDTHERTRHGARWALGLGAAAFALLLGASGCLVPEEGVAGEEDAKGTADTIGGVDVSGTGDTVEGAACVTASDCAGLPHDDCEGAWTCAAAVCAWQCHTTQVACSDALACPPNAVCQDGQCVPVTELGCLGDSDCPDGHVCRLAPCEPSDCKGGAETDCAPAPCLGAGVCVPEQPPASECTSDAQCGPGQRCNAADACLPPPGGGGSDMAPPVCWGVCVTLEGECWSNSDCGAGYVCKPDCAGGGKVPGDADAIVACPGQCVPDPGSNTCSSNADCKPGHSCHWLACFAPPAEDPPGQPEPCLGLCLPDPPAACQSDADCGKGEVCVFETTCKACDCLPGADGCSCPECAGVCKPQPKGECTADADCGKDAHCAFIDCPDCGCPPNQPCDCDAACYGVCVPNGPVIACVDHSDCPKGTSCACTPDPNCPMCDVCLMQCVPDGPTGCNVDDDCGKGQICVVGLCPPCAPGADCPECVGTCQPDWQGGQCASDGDCPKGTSCTCTPIPGCPECDGCYFQCVPTKPPVGCTADEQCGEGAYCDTSGCGAFFMPCDPATGCGVCQGVCKPRPDAECLGDADCQPGERCHFASCKGGEVCVGQCGPADADGCMVTGCSGEICAAEPVSSPCIIPPWFECLQHAQCGVRADGTCGWMGDALFEQCMADNKGDAF